MERDDKTITEQINDIMEAICADYCRYGVAFDAKKTVSDEEADKFYAERCAKCPLMKI